MASLIGAKIREARKAVGLKQGELAEKLGLPQSQVSDWERGANTPNVESLKKIAPIVKVDVMEFMAVLVGS
jgi:transcriptional regulator with XRE-family HTH domain